MLDRAPKYPGRVRLTPVPGQENTFDMTRADEATQDGTPLNTATLLKQQTAALFGLGAGAVPDDVLAYLGQYNQHWWWRKATTTQTRYDEVRTLYGSQLSLGQTSLYSAITVTYGAGIEIASDCTVSLKSPQTLSIDRYGKGDLLAGKYAQVGSAIYYIPSGAYLNVIGNSDNETLTAYYLANVVYTVTAFSYEVSVGEVDYVRSPDRNAYPDSGTSNGYEWKYLGVPFENAVTAPKIATGSYNGTGTITPGACCQITFPFAPKIVCISVYKNANGAFRPTHDVASNNSFASTVSMETLTTNWDNNGIGVLASGIYNYGQAKKSADGKTLYWFNSKQADWGANASNCTYYYYAIG